MTKLELKTEKIKNIKQIFESDTQTKLALLKNQFEISLILIDEIMEDEVRNYAGERYSRGKPHNGRYSRWGSNPGSVWIGEEKVGIEVARTYDKDKEIYKKKLNKAYNSETYQEASKELMAIYNELIKVNKNAANSLMEGLEETLTLHRPGLNEDFKKSFTTTNVIENLNSQIGKYTRKVKYWKTSDQRQRWIAAGLLEAEQKMHRVNNYQDLYILQEKIKQEVQLKLN